MSKERAFMEDLLNKRFNFFLVLFSAIVMGYVNAKDDVQRIVVLGIGSLVCTLIASTLGRAQEKLDIIINALRANSEHPVVVIENAAKPGGSRRWYIGYLIPVVCSVSLWLGFVVTLAHTICIGCRH